ncbi:hypothetical protein GGI42DRAFT_72939 [Trichoderma sp. SZMC 28013]
MPPDYILSSQPARASLSLCHFPLALLKLLSVGSCPEMASAVLPLWGCEEPRNALQCSDKARRHVYWPCLRASWRVTNCSPLGTGSTAAKILQPSNRLVPTIIESTKLVLSHSQILSNTIIFCKPKRGEATKCVLAQCPASVMSPFVSGRLATLYELTTLKRPLFLSPLLAHSPNGDAVSGRCRHAYVTCHCQHG